MISPERFTNSATTHYQLNIELYSFYEKSKIKLVAECIGTVVYEIACTIMDIVVALFEPIVHLFFDFKATTPPPIPKFSHMTTPQSWLQMAGRVGKTMGLPNFGGTCYGNATLQMLMSLTEFSETCAAKKDQIPAVLGRFCTLIDSLEADLVASNEIISLTSNEQTELGLPERVKISRDGSYRLDGEESTLSRLSPDQSRQLYQKVAGRLFRERMTGYFKEAIQVQGCDLVNSLLENLALLRSTQAGLSTQLHSELSTDRFNSEFTLINLSYEVIGQLLTVYLIHKYHRNTGSLGATSKPELENLPTAIETLHKLITDLQTSTFADIFLKLQNLAVNTLGGPLTTSQIQEKNRSIESLLKNYFWSIPNFYDDLETTAQTPSGRKFYSLNKFLSDITQPRIVRNEEGTITATHPSILRQAEDQPLRYFIHTFFSKYDPLSGKLIRYTFGSPSRAIHLCGDSADREALMPSIPGQPSQQPIPYRRPPFTTREQHDPSELIARIIAPRLGFASLYGFNKMKHTLRFPFQATYDPTSPLNNISVTATTPPVRLPPDLLPAQNPLTQTLHELMSYLIRKFLEKRVYPTAAPTSLRINVRFTETDAATPQVAIERRHYSRPPDRELLITKNPVNTREPTQSIVSRCALDVHGVEISGTMDDTVGRIRDRVLDLNQTTILDFLQLDPSSRLPSQLPIQFNLTGFEHGASTRGNTHRRVTDVMTTEISFPYYQGAAPETGASLNADLWKVARYKPTTFICHFGHDIGRGHFVTYRIEGSEVIRYDDRTVSYFTIPNPPGAEASVEELSRYGMLQANYKRVVQDVIESNLYYAVYESVPYEDRVTQA